MSEWMTYDEATAALNIGKHTIYRNRKRYNIRTKRGDDNRMVFHRGNVMALKESGYDPQEKRIRTAQYLTTDHPWVNYTKVEGSRETLTPLQAARAIMIAKRRIEAGIRVREIEAVDLSQFVDVP